LTQILDVSRLEKTRERPPAPKAPKIRRFFSTGSLGKSTAIEKIHISVIQVICLHKGDAV